jgi:hypothetical protein
MALNFLKSRITDDVDFILLIALAQFGYGDSTLVLIGSFSRKDLGGNDRTFNTWRSRKLVSRTSPAFHKYCAKQLLFRAKLSLTLWVILPTMISPERTSAPIRIIPDSSDF